MKNDFFERAKAISTSDSSLMSEADRCLLTLSEIEERSGLSNSKLRKDIRAKKLNPPQFGRAIRVTEKAYQAYPASQAERQASSPLLLTTGDAKPRTAPKPMLSPRFLTLSEVQAALDCSLATVRRRIASGKLRSFKHGRVLRVRESDLQAFIQASRRWR